MKTIKTMDGNEACANTAYMFTEIAGIYPITPSSAMAEHVDDWASHNRLNIFNDKVKVVEMQSEAGAAGFIHGALQNGVLATTFTASQGLLLMIPNMYKMAGEMLPCVMHVAARSLSTHALSIMGDHQDIYATRSTGFCMLASSSVQDAAYLSGIAHLSSIESSLSFMHFFDGFRTSHEMQKIELLDKEDYKSLIDYEALNKFRERALNPNKPKVVGTAENDDIYFQVTEARNSYYDKVPDIVNSYMEKINSIADTNYKPFNYYGDKYATKVIVAMGSVCETIKETIENKPDLGLVEVHLYRPFSTKYLLNALPNTVRNIAVLDRTKEFGSGEPLYLDVVSVLKDKDINIVGGRFGLSSKNTTPGMIMAVYDMLDNPKNNFTIGINDDVTNLSLKEKEINIKNSKEILIYGYGSDGMVSASKSLIKFIGDDTNKYVQGYFQYDSKKSGGVTISHIRLSNNKIRSTYYIEKPDILVVSNDNYFSEFELIKDIEENSTVIINTTKDKDELMSTFSNKFKSLLREKKSKIYIINAYKIAHNVGLGNKISMIMEAAIMYLTPQIDYSVAKVKLTEYIKNKFSKKGIEIVNSNIKALDLVEQSIEQIELNNMEQNKNNKELNIYELMYKREGNNLPVSAFKDMLDGTFKTSTSNISTQPISKFVPNYNKDNCISCNMCTMVCPHSVIRSYLLNEEEYSKAPDYIKNRCRKDGEYYFTIGINIKNCTGCGLCTKICPGFKGNKALNFMEISKAYQDKNMEIFNYLEKNITDKKMPKNNIKGLGFTKPNTEYCGACAGCGEAAYIKILTQLFKDNLVIANATGCSSIYGGSVPSIPYNLPWASSLFEDNAEYGYGMLISNNLIRNRIKNIMEQNLDNENSELFKTWINNYDNYEITKDIYNKLTDSIPKELKELKDYIPSRNYWAIGGDGWAYDIGFGGIDHVLASNDNINILVLDTEVYSNTGGQSSKSSHIGSIASFASSGKRTNKKDLARIAMSYKNAYVATISLGANMMQAIKTLKEANDHNGPSIVIAYCPCISHGIKGGMSNTTEIQKLATSCGYFPLFRRSSTGFTLDTKNVDFSKYDEFLNCQTRYSMLDPKVKEELLKSNIEYSKERFEYLQSLVKND